MKNIKTLLKKKKLTGKEAALLIIADDFEFYSSQGKKRILTDADRRSLVDSFEGSKNIKDYNAYTHIARRIFETLSTLEAVKGNTGLRVYKDIIEITELKWIDNCLRREIFTPQIMTQKQYKDMKKLQREMKLKKKVSLASLITDLAYEFYPDVSVFYDSPEEAESMAQLYEYEEDIEDLAKDYPDAYKTGYKKLIELIESEKLDVKIPKGRKITPRSYKLLKKIEISRESLYSAGIGKDFIDNYEPNRDEETGGTPAGVAIIQEAGKHQVDERGYYIDRLSYRSMRQAIQERRAESVKMINETIKELEEELKVILEYMEVVKAYSELLDFDFYSHAKRIFNLIVAIIDDYNDVIERNKESIMPALIETEELKHIDIETLRPSTEAIEKMKESIDIYKETWEELFEAIRSKENG